MGNISAIFSLFQTRVARSVSSWLFLEANNSSWRSSRPGNSTLWMSKCVGSRLTFERSVDATETVFTSCSQSITGDPFNLRYISFWRRTLSKVPPSFVKRTWYFSIIYPRVSINASEGGFTNSIAMPFVASSSLSRYMRNIWTRPTSFDAFDELDPISIVKVNLAGQNQKI